jgi:hypothetical protein
MKEALRVSTRSLLLTALILSSSALQALAHYHPDEGRWMSRDPISEEGGQNLYAFVNNDPTDFIDPYGLATYILMYQDTLDGEVFFPQWAAYVEGLIKRNGSTIYGNTFHYDPNCDKIVKIVVKTHDDALSIKNYDDVKYLASFGHGNKKGMMWYNTPAGSVVFSTGSTNVLHETSVVRMLSNFGGVKFMDGAFVELYHCYTRAGDNPVAGYFEKLWSVPVYGTENGMDNGHWYHRGYPIFHKGEGNDKNPNWPGASPSNPRPKVPVPAPNPPKKGP